MENSVQIEINNNRYPLRLTMGALSELEAHFKVTDLVSLTTRLAQPAAHDLIAALVILIRAGGKDIDPTHIANSNLNPIQALRAIVQLFQKAISEMAEADSELPGKDRATPPAGVSTRSASGK